MSPALAGRFFTAESPGKLKWIYAQLDSTLCWNMLHMLCNNIGELLATLPRSGFKRRSIEMKPPVCVLPTAKKLLPIYTA